MNEYLDSLIHKLVVLKNQLIFSEITPGQVIKIHMLENQSSFNMIVRYVIKEDLSVLSTNSESPAFLNKKDPGIYASMSNYDTARTRYSYVKAQSGYFNIVTSKKSPEIIEYLPMDDYGTVWVASLLGRINLNNITTLDLLKI